jgi:hypothetical protein
MADLSPAEQLREAAQEMRGYATAAADDPFIAGWVSWYIHPAVIAAVADLLDATSTCECEKGDDHADIKQAALAIARAYLAGESP